MRDSWAEVTLGDVADINPDNTDQLRDNDEITYIDLSSVSSAAGISADLFRGSYRTAPGRARRIVRKDDVLISTVRPYLKGFSMVPQYLDGAVASTGFCVLRAKRKQILPGLIWAVVGTDQFVENLMSKATGSSYPAVRPSDVAAHPIALPPLAEQTRIVDVMASVDAYIAALQQQADDARSARNAVLHELLTAGGSSWIETTIGEAVNIQKGKKPPSLGDKATIGQPYLTADVLRGSAPSQFVPQSALGMCVQLEEDETVLLWDGAGAGDVFRSTTGVLASTMARLSNKSKASLESRFLHLAVQEKSPEIKLSCRGTTVPHVSPSALAATTLLIPPLPEQKRIVETVTAMDDVVSATEQAVRVAQQLRAGLLSTLLLGEHEIPDTYDRLLGAA